jgi:splicing factor U2AF 35 kDa subunit
MSSHTVLLSNLYENPKLNKNNDELVPKQVQQHVDQFYKDVFIKLTDIGEVKAMIVCENENDHLNGNVYVRFKEKDSAYNAMVTPLLVLFSQ